MNMFLKKYSGKTLEDWGSELSPDFKSFARAFRSYLKSEGMQHGFTVEAFHTGHYDVSAFLKFANERYVYMSYGNRFSPIDVYSTSFLGGGVLIRTAKSVKDYTGGMNHYTSLAEIGSAAKKLHN